MTLCFTSAADQFVIAAAESTLRITVLYPQAVRESWDSGLWVPLQFLQSLDKRFKIRWVEEPDWNLPVIQLSLHDSAILLAILSHIPGEHCLNYIAHRSPYWLFHDYVHSILDIRSGTHPVTGEEFDYFTAQYMEIDEDRVLEESASLAVEHGMDAGKVRYEIDRAKSRRNRNQVD